MAYCRNCGNLLSDDSAFCSRCGTRVVAEEPTSTYEVRTEPIAKEAPAGVYGLGKAITGAIFAFVSFVFSMVAEVMAVLTEDSYSYRYGYDADLAEATIVISVISIIFGVLAIVFGAKSIRNYKYAKREYEKNPIATLVLGIVGVALGAFSIFIAFCFMMAAVTCL